MEAKDRFCWFEPVRFTDLFVTATSIALTNNPISSPITLHSNAQTLFWSKDLMYFFPPLFVGPLPGIVSIIFFLLSTLFLFKVHVKSHLFGEAFPYHPSFRRVIVSLTSFIHSFILLIHSMGIFMNVRNCAVYSEEDRSLATLYPKV